MNRFLLSLLGLLFVVLQITLANLISVFGIKPDFIVLFVIVRSLLEGPTAGVVWGFSLGFLLDAASGGILGLGSLIYCLAGFISGQIGAKKYTNWVHYIVALAVVVPAVHSLFFYLHEPWQQIDLLRLIFLRLLPSVVFTWILGFFWMLSPFSRFKSEKRRG
jgi:rod shape-determining protein MreD